MCINKTNRAQDDSPGMLQQYLLRPWEGQREANPGEHSTTESALRLLCSLEEKGFISSWLSACLHGVGITLATITQEFTPRLLEFLKNSAYKMRLWEKQDSLPWGLPFGNLPPLRIIDSKDDCPSQVRPHVIPGTRPLPFRRQKDIRI